MFPGKFDSPQEKLIGILFNRFCMRNASRVTDRPKTYDFREFVEIQHWVEAEPSAQSLLQKSIFDQSDRNFHKSRYQNFLVLPNVS